MPAPLDETTSPIRIPAFARALPPLPRQDSLNKLIAALEETGHPSSAAKAVARAVVNPTAFRKQLKSPSIQRVTDGALHVVHTTVWTPAILPMPTNARLAPDRTYPIGGGTSRIPLPQPNAVASTPSERSIRTKNPDELLAALTRELEYLLDRNNLVESISGEGVREALLLSPLIFDFSADHGSIATLVADDGSSRAASCYDILDLTPHEVLFQLAQDESVFRTRLQDVLRLVDEDVRALTDNDLARLAAITIPAAVVIGFTADDPDSKMDIVQAIRSRVGHLHVDPPSPWDEAGALDEQLNAALEECVRQGKADSATAAYLAGTLDPQEAEAAGFSRLLDVRAGALHDFFSSDDNRFAINEGIRSVAAVSSARSRPRVRSRLALAVEASLRPFRGNLSRSNTDAIRTSLTKLYNMDELIAEEWSITAKATPENLRDDALSEQQAGTIGPACRSLLILGGYWLVRNRALHATVGGGMDERREIPAILLTLATGERGIHQLYQALVDGRDGGEPRAVGQDGRPVPTIRRGFQVVHPDWVLAEFPPQQQVEVESPADSTTEPPASPQARLAQRKSGVRHDAEMLKRAVLEGLSEPVDDDTGRPLVEVIGLPEPYVEEVNRHLSDVTGRLNMFAMIARDRAQSLDDSADGGEPDE